MSYREAFLKHYTAELLVEIAARPQDYGYGADRAPGVAELMVAALATGSGSKDSRAIKRTCKALGVPWRYEAIRMFLNEARGENK